MIASLVFQRRYRRFVEACERPLRTQAARLRAILAQAESTAIGLRSDFGRIRRIRDDASLIRAYQEAVPIRTHAGMRADLDAVYEGDCVRVGRCFSR